MTKPIAFVLLLLSCSLAFAERLELEKKDYIKLIVSSYVNGFKEFDTSVTTFDDSVSIGIYYDVSAQKESRAEQLAKRFRRHVPLILANYEWAKNVKLRVSVYSENITERGY